jgi:signal transduction histidine kinase
MIEDILDLSKIVQGKLELNYGLVNLPVILQSAIALSQEEADAKGIRITAAIHFQGGKVWGDPVRIQQVVQNLLKNAIKFTPDAGTIQINLQRVQDSSIQFRTQHLDSPSVFAPHPEEHVQIQVIDSGVGISPEFLPKVFDRFRQADSSSTREFNGLGLGLAIVRHLVELNGGQVVAFSAGKDQGATFTVKLPIWQDVRSRPTRQSRESAIA